MNETLKPFFCNNKLYMMPKQHCVFCKNCPSYVYDNAHGPYVFFCNLNLEFEKCDSFEEENSNG